METEEHDDQRATKSPDEGAAPEPTPGEDQGPMGNPSEDEEALSHSQQDASDESPEDEG